MTETESMIVTRIRQSMKKRKVTQEELAKAIGVKQYTISRMLNASPFPSAEQLIAIAQALDVSLYYLLGVQEESYRELSPKGRLIADAYQDADPVVQAIVDRILLVKE